MDLIALIVRNWKTSLVAVACVPVYLATIFGYIPKECGILIILALVILGLFLAKDSDMQIPR